MVLALDLYQQSLKCDAVTQNRGISINRPKDTLDKGSDIS